MLEFGLDTFGDVTAFGETAELLPHAQVIRNVIDEAVQAEAVGVDFFGVGEHHRSDFAVSAPEVVLSAIAARTSRIHIGTAVTVLSSDDPVRLFQRFATLDAISNGRAEVILGRGSFTESFPLFGFELSHYEELFEDKLDLFAALVRQDVVSWQGSTRPPLVEQQVFPPVEHGRLKTWIGVGGSPESVVRAAKYDMPLMLAIIGGNPRRFLPYVELSQRAHAQLGTPMQPVGIHSPGYVAETDTQAREEMWPSFKQMRDRIGKERGWPPTNRGQFDATRGPEGAYLIGEPEQVAEKILRENEALGGLARITFQMTNVTMPHSKMLKSIELLGTKVAPIVRKALG